MHTSKGVLKIMLKARDFTENKLCHRYFESNFAENFQNKHSWEQHRTDTFNSCFNDRLMS